MVSFGSRLQILYPNCKALLIQCEIQVQEDFTRKMAIHQHGEVTNIIVILIIEEFLARNNDLRATKLFRVKTKLKCINRTRAY